MPAPTGPQFVTVYHSSDRMTPPHEVTYSRNETGTDWQPGATIEQDNRDPKIIHAGTEESTKGFSRPYTHVYEIPVEHQYPVTFGDAPEMTFRDDRESFDPETGLPQSSGSFISPYQQRLRGVQQGLFESTPGDPKLAIRTNMAVPYRNKGEDMGSISWMIPKDAVRSGRIRYAGLKEDY